MMKSQCCTLFQLIRKQLGWPGLIMIKSDIIEEKFLISLRKRLIIIINN